VSYKQIFKIAVPISFAILIPQLNFFINTIFLSHLPSTEAWGVAGITGVYFLVFSSVGYGLNNGLQSLISRYAGKNDAKGIGVIFSQGVFIALLLALLGIVITYTVLPFLLKLFLKDNIVNLAMDFLYVRIWGLPFLYMFQMRNALLVGTNQSKFLPIGTAAETLVNILLDYALIFGHWGLPALGFNGAAYASLFADFTGMLITYLIVYFGGINKRFGITIQTKFNKTIIKEILKQSGPLMFQHAISIISWLLFFLLIGRMEQSTVNLAVSNTMRTVFALFGVVTWALGSTTNTLISNLIGQGQLHNVPLAWKKLMKVSFFTSLCIAVVLQVFPRQIFTLFNEQSLYVEAAIPVIRVISLATIIMSVSVVCLNTVIGSGNAKYSLFIEIASIIIYCSYTIIAMEVIKVPIAVAWMNEWIYWTVLLLLSVWYIKKRLHKTVQ
jgi:multidrug resistance protein, MATE family